MKIASSLRLALSLSLVALAGCGGDGGGETDGGPAEDAASGDAGHDAGRPFACPEVEEPAGFHVSVDGSPEGDGSASDPWDLQTALDMPDAVSPGDTIWMHGGVYAGGFVSRLEGTEEAPVTLRSYPGQWAVIDGAPHDDSTLQVYRGFGVYRDFELVNTTTDRTGSRESALWLEGRGISLVNLVVHDTGNVPMYEEAPDLLVYGSLFYAGGYDDSDRAHGHGIYVQNETGEKRIEENLIFHTFSFGAHAYAEGGSFLEHMRFVGNVWWGAGVAAAGTGTEKDNCLIGGADVPADDIELRENFGFVPSPEQRSVRLGWSGPNGSIALSDNYFVGQTIFAETWSSVTMTGNTFVGPVSGEVDTGAHPDNDYLGSAPAETRVFVRPNRYEPGRAHVIVYNWAGASEVEVDLGDVLAEGTPFEICNAEDYFAEPLVTGSWAGDPVTLPMEGLTVAQPIGSPDAIAPSERTGSAFHVFVVRPACPAP